jgi:preprotein translocase subunit YajC
MNYVKKIHEHNIDYNQLTLLFLVCYIFTPKEMSIHRKQKKKKKKTQKSFCNMK